MLEQYGFRILLYQKIRLLNFSFRGRDSRIYTSIFHKVKRLELLFIEWLKSILIIRKIYIAFKRTRYMAYPYLICKVLLNKLSICPCSTNHKYSPNIEAFKRGIACLDTLKYFSSFEGFDILRQNDIATMWKWFTKGFKGFSTHDDYMIFGYLVKMLALVFVRPCELAIFSETARFVHCNYERRNHNKKLKSECKCPSTNGP